MKKYLVILLLIALIKDINEGSILSSHNNYVSYKIINNNARHNINDKIYINKINNDISDDKNCGLMDFGVVKKIPYSENNDIIDITFSSACVRCGLCLVIADKINKTLIDIHDAMSPDRWLNTTEVEELFSLICNQSFIHYRLREINGERYVGESIIGSQLVETTVNGLWGSKLKEKCTELFDEINPENLYKQWLEWYYYDDSQIKKSLSEILCMSDLGILRDCRSIGDNEKSIKLLSQVQEPERMGFKFKVSFSCG